MKKLLLVCLLAGVCVPLQAQKNILKGRAFWFPGNGLQVFSLGVGYERFLTRHLSAQVLLNRMGYDKRDHDGAACFVTSLVPELRYYLRDRDRMSQSAFFAAFAEVQDVDEYKSGFDVICDPGPCPVAVSSTRRDHAQGMLLGHTLRLWKRWHLEGYAGPRFTTTTEEVVYDNGSFFTFRYTRWQVRMGLNIAWRF